MNMCARQWCRTLRNGYYAPSRSGLVASTPHGSDALDGASGRLRNRLRVTIPRAHRAVCVPVTMNGQRDFQLTVAEYDRFLIC